MDDNDTLGNDLCDNDEPTDALSQTVWNPKGGLKHIPEGILYKANELVDAGLITDVKIKKDKDGNYIVEISSNSYVCEYGAFRNTIKKDAENIKITRNITNSLDETCDNASCGEIRCFLKLAAFIKYSRENGTFDTLMEKREQYRKKHNNQDENLLFTWKPCDKDKFQRLPRYMFDLAEDLIKKGLITLRPSLSEDGWIVVDFKRLGRCANKDKDRKMVGSFTAGPHDIKRALSFIKKPVGDMPDGYRFRSDAPCMNCMLCNCKTNFCPYSIAAYVLYLRLTGQEDIISVAKKFSSEHPNEVYYGDDEFDLGKFDDTDIAQIRQSIASAPTDILMEAFRLLDNGEAFLMSSKIHSGVKGDEELYFGINISKDTKNRSLVSECVNTEYDKISHWWYVKTIFDNPSTVEQRLIKLVACIDYCRRKHIDISDAVNKRYEDINKIQEMTSEIVGLDRLYSFVKSNKTSSLFCIMQGDVGSGKGSIIESIANILSQKGKTTTNKYKKMTLEQLSDALTVARQDEGYIFSGLEKKSLYVLTNLEEFLLFNGFYNNKNYMTMGVTLRHFLKVLGEFSENTYVIIVSLSKASTESFLDLDKKYKYTYGQNVIVFKNKSAGELYQEYIRELSENVKNQIEDEEQYKTKFAEFIALNERFLPFKNSALSHYLAEYSNVEGAPVLPPNVYDKKEVEYSLDNMVGMQAVKKQLSGFESYITFQKKAKVAGIKIKQGNLHMQFLGNPGTGKTTIARIVVKMLYDIGILEENKVVEVERKDLVAQYLGETAIKTSKKIQEAMGGVLFIDEAYSLYLSDGDDFGKEAIATLVKAMEDFKDKFIVIFAGYNKEMQAFLKANSGIESRIGYTFHFEDYTTSELTEIFRRSIIKQNFEIADGVLSKVSDICDYYRRRKNFGNGRFVKKIEQQILINHANNMNSKGWDLKIITINDVPEIKELGTLSSGSQENEITLDQVIGMSSVKEQIKKFQTKLRFEQKAKAVGAKIKRGNSHMLFLGNPGTGKTTIARIITKELYEAGVILENKLIEVESKDLIAKYVGQTAPKTSDVIERAMGGVLFIDEAYSLVRQTDYGNDYGQEAIATIVKAMEDHKDALVIIFAGYKKEMQNFLESNSGIASRIGYTFTFDDYTAEELTDIFKLKLDINHLTYTEDALKTVKDVMQYFVSVPNFGNGRFAERVVNFAIELHSERIVENDNTTDDLLKITEEDIPSVKYILDHMPDGKKMINPEKIKDTQYECTAVHELGHALIFKLSNPSDSIERITISAEGSGALGYVRYNVDGVGTYTKRELEKRICISMAGIAAEEVFFGEYDNGGTSDLENATKIATNMILHYGMSKTGFACFKELDDSGKQEVNEILKAQFDKAKQTINEYRDKLLEAKEFLLANKTITDEDFSRIVLGK